MKARLVAIVLAAGGVAAAFTAPAAAAGPTATCGSGDLCVWSGANYTGQLAVLSQDPWAGCETAASLGLTAIRSAMRNGAPCSIQAALYADTVCGRPADPEHIGFQTPTVSPAALSLEQFQIPC